MPRGYMGKIALVDLSEEKVRFEELDMDRAKALIGGVGYAADLIIREVPKGADPLGPDNVLVVATGPLTGTAVPTSGVEFCFKSPLTDIWGETKVGGRFGPYLKFSGYDILILKGKAEKPKYLFLNDGDVEIRRADHLWGLTVPEATETLLKETDEEASVAIIGPAGEKLVRFANIIVDHDRHAGRTGGGAVMGSKNLKGIVVIGNKEIEVERGEEFMRLVSELDGVMRKDENREAYMLYGTPGFLPYASSVEDLPTKYYTQFSWEKADSVFERWYKDHFVSVKACFGCNISCGRVSQSVDGLFGSPPYGGPEYETMGALGSLTLVDDPRAIVRASYLTDLYGMDSISTGSVISFLMFLSERGKVSSEDVGFELKWGDGGALVRLVEMIGRREGIGGSAR